MKKILLLFLLISLVSPFPVHAEQLFRVSPVIINIPLSPGKTMQQDVIIENLTNAPLPLKTNLTDFQTTGEEGDYVFPQTQINPLLSWITLSNTSVILAPHEQKHIKLSIKTPNSISIGGYYGILFFETLPQQIQQTQTRVAAKVGILLLAEIGVPDPHAKQAEILTMKTSLFQQNAFSFLLRVQNISLHHFTAKPILTFTPFLPLGQTHNKPTLLEEKIIFPGKVRRWEQTVTTNLQPNIYMLHLTLSTGNGNTIRRDRYVVVLPNNLIMTITGCAITLFFLILLRKQLARALKAFLSKT